jgi:uncharacterized membrane protein
VLAVSAFNIDSYMQNGLSKELNYFLLCSNQVFDFLLLDKSNMVNDVPENNNFAYLNPVSSLCCELWIPHSTPYSLQVHGQSCYLQTRVISKAGL